MRSPFAQKNVLVLDAGYQPVNVVSARKAMLLLYTGRATMVTESGTVIHSPGKEWSLPKIIRLFISIAHRVYRMVKIQLNRRNLLIRDGYTCQYCGTQEGPLTIDHVVPKSRRTGRYSKGGVTSWENCVICCEKCNHRKGDRLPEELNMSLRKKPMEPRWLPPMMFRHFFENRMDECWKRYLYLK
jgi:5-methylcytosine-specific restriction endonuclease McrA